ncbi:hypothetical protein EUTSA_v100238501mg, partial [Eutrema salsugineum]
FQFATLLNRSLLPRNRREQDLCFLRRLLSNLHRSLWILVTAVAEMNACMICLIWVGFSYNLPVVVEDDIDW